MSHQSAEQSAKQKLANITAPSIAGIAGLSIIVGAFVISIVTAPVNLGETFRSWI